MHLFPLDSDSDDEADDRRRAKRLTDDKAQGAVSLRVNKSLHEAEEGMSEGRIDALASINKTSSFKAFISRAGNGADDIRRLTTSNLLVNAGGTPIAKLAHAPPQLAAAVEAVKVAAGREFGQRQSSGREALSSNAATKLTNSLFQGKLCWSDWVGAVRRLRESSANKAPEGSLAEVDVTASVLSRSSLLASFM